MRVISNCVIQKYQSTIIKSVSCLFQQQRRGDHAVSPDQRSRAAILTFPSSLSSRAKTPVLSVNSFTLTAGNGWVVVKSPCVPHLMGRQREIFAVLNRVVFLMFYFFFTQEQTTSHHDNLTVMNSHECYCTRVWRLPPGPSAACAPPPLPWCSKRSCLEPKTSIPEPPRSPPDKHNANTKIRITGQWRTAPPAGHQ